MIYVRLSHVIILPCKNYWYHLYQLDGRATLAERVDWGQVVGWVHWVSVSLPWRISTLRMGWPLAARKSLFPERPSRDQYKPLYLRLTPACAKYRGLICIQVIQI